MLPPLMSHHAGQAPCHVQGVPWATLGLSGAPQLMSSQQPHPSLLYLKPVLSLLLPASLRASWQHQQTMRL
jgi:hypothetical protein